MLCIWGTSIIIQPKLGVDTCAFFFLALRKRGLKMPDEKGQKDKQLSTKYYTTN